jgi:hypothetical protein
MNSESEYRRWAAACLDLDLRHRSGCYLRRREFDFLVGFHPRFAGKLSRDPKGF